MAYTLIGSERSPFVRICRILMIQNHIDFDFRIMNFLDDPVARTELPKITPINKVPILIDGGQKIFDSRVIVNYLTEKHGLRRLSLDEENLVSSVYTCLDTAVILFLMRRDGFDLKTPGIFLSRQLERIPRNLEYLTPWARGLDPARPTDWYYPSMALYSFLYWAHAREVLKISDYPAMADFLQRFQNAAGVKETTF